MIHLILERQVPHPPHLVLQSRERASQSRLFRTHTNPKVAFLIASAVQGKPQEVDRLWAFTATLASVSMREATKFNELGLHRFQGQTEFSQPFGKRFLSTESIRTKLETQHEVADISHHAGLAAKSRLDHSLEPQIEHISIGPEEPASISDSRVATPTGPLPHLNASKIVLVYKLSAGNLQVECKIISAIMSTGCVQRSTGPLQCLQVEYSSTADVPIDQC